jgi:hypothetical protein
MCHGQGKGTDHAQIVPGFYGKFSLLAFAGTARMVEFLREPGNHTGYAAGGGKT